ncbi:host attachment family protein [Roseibacterium sp. SDUM158017]|uniref:host attachment family protein n=1 Tax=Roseicyclus salinarum TaxID=3036773 RepID=UPI0024156D95|nr:host attachment family protein [Roseibacterium sp. SDUM158017]MDG4647811.1 host attachment family protein [Roseibacterium sp. SDUM158017]
MDRTARRSGLPQGAWVVVANGNKALFLVNWGDDMDMNLVVHRHEEHENPKASEWATDRPGRFNDGPAVQRSAVQETDWHELEKERFGADLAKKLYADAHAGRFRHLVVMASRTVLSTLRKELHPEVAEKIILEVPKVLTNHPIDEVEVILTEALRTGG